MKQIVENVPFSALRSGDVVQAGYSQAGTVNVEREVPDPPKPAGPKPGTRGTAIVYGERIPGMIDEDGDFAFLTFDSGYLGRDFVNVRNATEFVPDSDSDSDEKTEPVKPQITREQFIQTLHKTVSDNGLDIDSGPLGTLVVFAADRLGLY